MTANNNQNTSIVTIQLKYDEFIDTTLIKTNDSNTVNKLMLEAIDYEHENNDCCNNISILDKFRDLIKKHNIYCEFIKYENLEYYY